MAAGIAISSEQYITLGSSTRAVTVNHFLFTSNPYLDVRNADLANTVTTAVNAAVTTAVNAAVTTAVNAAMGQFLRNQRAWNRNRKNCIAALGPLTAIEKTVPGVGLGLPTPPNNPGAAPPALAVGAMPANFPGTFANLGSLVKKDIHQLAIQYNEDFGILAGDHVTVCRQKFQDWICGM